MSHKCRLHSQTCTVQVGCASRWCFFLGVQIWSQFVVSGLPLLHVNCCHRPCQTKNDSAARECRQGLQLSFLGVRRMAFELTPASSLANALIPHYPSLQPMLWSLVTQPVSHSRDPSQHHTIAEFPSVLPRSGSYPQICGTFGQIICLGPLYSCTALWPWLTSRSRTCPLRWNVMS